MMIETLQSAVALSLDIPLIIKELFELIGTKLPFSGEIIFIPPLTLGIVELRVEPV